MDNAFAMTRPERIYVLTAPGLPPVTWTIRHELHEWLRTLADVPAGWRLWCCRDGQMGNATEMSIQAVIAAG